MGTENQGNMEWQISFRKIITMKINSQYKHSQELHEFIKSLPKNFEREGEILYDERNVIKSFMVRTHEKYTEKVVVKRYKCPNIIQQIIYSFFRKSKAERAFSYGIQLQEASINTPTPIAYFEEWKNGLFKFGYYLSGYDNAPAIRKELIEKEEFNQTMAEDFAIFVANLHNKDILHHDLNSTNVLYHPEANGHFSFSVIDINRMTFKKSNLTLSECLDNLTRFTGRMDLFEYVLKKYIQYRGLPLQKTLQEGIAIKIKHDRDWYRRKNFFKKIKSFIK